MRAGVEGEGCRTGHRGPLCAACEAGWSIYNGICEQCTEEVRGRSIAVIVVFFLIVAVAVAAAAAWKVRTMLKQRKEADGDGASGDEAQSPSSEGLAASKTVDARQLKRRAAQVAAWAQQRYANSLKVKVSLTVAFLQILGIFGLCFQVDWPDEYEVVVRDVNALMNLNPIGPVSAACVFPGFRWTWRVARSRQRPPPRRLKSPPSDSVGPIHAPPRDVLRGVEVPSPLPNRPDVIEPYAGRRTRPPAVNLESVRNKKE